MTPTNKPRNVKARAEKIKTGNVRVISVAVFSARGRSASIILNSHPVKSHINPKGMIRRILRLNFGVIPGNISEVFKPPAKVTLEKCINQANT